MLMSLFCFSQGTPSKTIINGDTFALLPIAQVRMANVKFVALDECNELNDSLHSQIKNYEQSINIKQQLISKYIEEITIQNKIQVEKDRIIMDCEKQLASELRKTKVLKVINKVMGATLGVVAVAGATIYVLSQ